MDKVWDKSCVWFFFAGMALMNQMIFVTASNSKIYGKEPQYNYFHLVLAVIFCQALGPSLQQGSNCIIMDYTHTQGFIVKMISSCRCFQINLFCFGKIAKNKVQSALSQTIFFKSSYFCPSTSRRSWFVCIALSLSKAHVSPSLPALS